MAQKAKHGIEIYPANYILADDCTPIFKSLLFMNGIGGVLNPEYTSHAHTLDCTTFLYMISMSPCHLPTFIALFNNHAPEYEVEWNVPFTVHHNKTKNQVIFDKALPKSSMNIKESLYMMYNKKTRQCLLKV